MPSVMTRFTVGDQLVVKVAALTNAPGLVAVIEMFIAPSLAA